MRIAKGLSALSIVALLTLGACSRSTNSTPGIVPRGTAGFSSSGAIEDANQAGRNPTVHCLLIGADDSRAGAQSGLKPLKYAARDAQMLSEAWQTFGVPQGNIDTLTNATATRELIGSIIDKRAALTIAGDTIVVTFIGHGVLHGGETHLLLHDQAIPASQFFQLLSALKKANVLVILDACHSDSAGNLQFLTDAESMRPEGVVALISSAQEDEQAYESSALEHGVFAHALAELLRDAQPADTNRDGFLSVAEIADPVTQKVKKYVAQASGKQTPHYRALNLNTQHVLPLSRLWSLDVKQINQQNYRATIGIPKGLPPSNRIWIVVVPEGSNGGQVAWPQRQFVLTPDHATPASGTILLGTASHGTRESYRVVLVEVDEDGHKDLASNETVSAYSLKGNIRFELTVTRPD